MAPGTLQKKVLSQTKSSDRRGLLLGFWLPSAPSNQSPCWPLVGETLYSFLRRYHCTADASGALHIQSALLLFCQPDSSSHAESFQRKRCTLVEFAALPVLLICQLARRGMDRRDIAVHKQCAVSPSLLRSWKPCLQHQRRTFSRVVLPGPEVQHSGHSFPTNAGLRAQHVKQVHATESALKGTYSPFSMFWTSLIAGVDCKVSFECWQVMPRLLSLSLVWKVAGVQLDLGVSSRPCVSLLRSMDSQQQCNRFVYTHLLSSIASVHSF